MEQYEVKIFPTAKQDFLEIIDYLNTLSAEVALRYYDKLTEEIGSLSHMPERCPHPRDLALAAKGYRYLVVENYLFFTRFQAKPCRSNVSSMGGGIIRAFYKHEGRGHKRVPDPFLSPGNQGEDLLSKGDHDTAGDGEDAVGTLGGVMGLEGQAHLQNSVAQQDEPHRPDQREDKVGQAVDHRKRVVGSQGWDSHHGCHGQGAYQSSICPVGATLPLPVVAQILILIHAAFSFFDLCSAENAMKRGIPVNAGV